MNRLWLLLLAFLTLGVDTEDEGGGDPPDVDAAGTEDLEEMIDDVEDAGGGIEASDDDEPAPPKKRTPSAREVELETEVRVLRERTTPTPTPTATPDVEFQQEEAQLEAARKSGDEAQLKWTQFHVTTQRQMRESVRNSNMALARANDIADRANFDRLKDTKPEYYKRYAEKVEAAAAEFHAKGQYPARAFLLMMLIGKDAVEGKVTSKKRETATVPRGRSPMTRGDVGAKGGGKLTPGQAAARRLEGKSI